MTTNACAVPLALAIGALAAAALAAPMEFGLDAGDYPARGWSSYDAFDLNVKEENVRSQIDALAPYRDSGDFRYLLIDEGWAEAIKPDSKTWFLDEWCRPMPNPNTFPGTVIDGGKNGSFAQLSTDMRAKGFSLGLWHIKGIPKAAVERNCKILGTNFTARDIADTTRTCVWHESGGGVKDIYELKKKHDGALAYYRSIAMLFKEWGVEYFKVDCVFGERDWDENAIHTYSKALASVFPDRKMVFSTSPGVNSQLQHADATDRDMSSYRITDDLWDSWGPEHAGPSGITVHHCIKALVLFHKITGRRAGFGGGRAYADADMLPFGTIRLGGEHLSKMPGPESRLVYALWSIANSPIVLGGDMTAAKTNKWLHDMLANEHLGSLGKTAREPRVLLYREAQPGRDGVSVWVANHKGRTDTRFLGVFPAALNAGKYGVVEQTVMVKQLQFRGVVRLRLYDLFNVSNTVVVPPGTANITIRCRTNDAAVFRVVTEAAKVDDPFDHNDGHTAAQQQQPQQQQHPVSPHATAAVGTNAMPGVPRLGGFGLPGQAKAGIAANLGAHHRTNPAVPSHHEDGGSGVSLVTVIVVAAVALGVGFLLRGRRGVHAAHDATKVN